MRIALLTRNAGLYSSRRLIEAARERGHEMIPFDTLGFVIEMGEEGPRLVYGGKGPEEGGAPVEAVIPRIGVSVTYYGTAVLRQFEVMGTYTLNGSIAILRSRDKLRSLQVLSAEGLGMPRTAISNSSHGIHDALAFVGGAPAIIKSLQGTQGLGVGIVESERSATSVMEAFMAANSDVLVQEFIAEAGNSDIRVIVIGDRAVAAMKRTGADGDFRSNLHRGGGAEVVELSEQEEQTAVRAARALGLNVCGVDLLRAERGPVIMEVNSSPGLEGIETATGIDVAGQIVEFLETHRDTVRQPTREAPVG